jgi:two-component system, cell cycle sensor histidine kinase and response regulator CckA
LANNRRSTFDRQLDWTPIQVLLIEDNRAESRFIQEVLRDAVVPMTIVSVLHLQEAIERLAHQTFDVVLLDLTLPDSSGLDSLDRLLHHAGPLPVVILTQVNDENLAVEAVRRGAQDYLFKRHIDEDSLVRSLRYAIERKQAAEALREANELLEQRVVERTAELAEANQLLQAEIIQRQQMETQFLHAQRLESLGNAG